MSRTAVHAALGDEHRLAIADALALGDLTPGRLAELLGVESNLLAHHLRVLEEAGVVSRHRSEADARRAYVSLRVDNPVVAATVGMPTVPAAGRVLFVCSRNSARSQMAAAVFAAESGVGVASAGTDPAEAIHPLALEQLTAHGLAPLSAVPAAVGDVAAPGDLVVAVCDRAYESLATSASSPDLHWSIPDPATRGTRDDFAAAFDIVADRARRLARAI